MPKVHAIAAVAGALVLLPAAHAQAGDFWDRYREQYPKCTSLVDQHEAKTKEIEAEAESVRYRTASARDPDKLNKLSQERSQIFALIQDCIMQNYSGRSFRLDATHNVVGLPAMDGTTDFEGSPFKVDLEAGHYLGDKVEGTVRDHTTYDYAWGHIDKANEGLFHVTKVRNRATQKTKIVNFAVPMNLHTR